MERKMTPNEMKLTQQDLAFKQAVVADVEKKVKEILPALVTACIADIWAPFIEETIETINQLEVQVEILKSKDSK